MTIGEALKSYPTIETDLLLAYRLGKPKEFLFLHPEKLLTKSQEHNFNQLCRRRVKGEPYAYIVGYKYFCGLKFQVNKNVLIPRPETEWLVERGVSIIDDELKDSAVKKPLRILDLGTGSGCIAISLSKNLHYNKQIKLFASDISAPALAVARKNARFYKTAVRFITSNLLDEVPGKFDLIIANLPYVPAVDYAKLKANLKYEPKLALTYKTARFQLYKKLFQQLSPHLNERGKLLLEIDRSASVTLIKYQKEILPHMKAGFHKDYNGLVRFMELSLK